MDEKKIKAVYYPYYNLSDKLLKQLVLYFDEITICLPKYFVIPNKYLFFHNNNLVNIYINQFEIEPPEKNSLQEIQQIIQEFGNSLKSPGIPLEIKQKLQESFPETIKQNLGQILNEQSQILNEIQEATENILNKWVKELPQDQKLPEEFKNLQNGLEKLKDTKNFKEKVRQSTFTEQFMPFEEFLPKGFLLEERISAHLGLFIDSYASGQIPFTDYPKAQEVFMRTFQANVKKEENAGMFHEVLRDHKAGHLIKEIMKNHLSPLPGLETKSHEDILYLKEELKDELEAYKLEMRKLVWDIKSNPWEDDFEGEITRVIDTKINPTVNELAKRKKKDSRISKFLKLGTEISNMILTATVQPHISTILALLIVSGASATIMGKWLEAQSKKQSEYNSLNFLVELKKELTD